MKTRFYSWHLDLVLEVQAEYQYFCFCCQGLKECKWPGRNQIIQSKNPLITYYIDGAHTIESVQQFIAWVEKVKPQGTHEKIVLLFNYTGDRNGMEFLQTLMVRTWFISSILVHVVCCRKRFWTFEIIATFRFAKSFCFNLLSSTFNSMRLDFPN